MKTKIKILIPCLLFNSCITLLPVNASHYSYISQTSISSSHKKIDTYADKLEWRYKTIRGKLYKRLYNSSKQRWETDWILVS